MDSEDASSAAAAEAAVADYDVGAQRAVLHAYAARNPPSAGVIAHFNALLEVGLPRILSGLRHTVVPVPSAGLEAHISLTGLRILHPTAAESQLRDSSGGAAVSPREARARKLTLASDVLVDV